MTTITTHEAKTHLSHYLAKVEKGRKLLIARDNFAVAALAPVPSKRWSRPAAGNIKGKPFEFPESAFASLAADELRGWGL